MRRELTTLCAPAALLCLAACSSTRGPVAGRAIITLDDAEAATDAEHRAAGDSVTLLGLPLPGSGDSDAEIVWSQAPVPNSAHPAWGAPLAISRDGSRAVVAGGAGGALTLLDVSGGEVRVLDVASGVARPVSVSMRPDGGVVAAASEDGRELWLITLTESGVRGSTPMPLTWLLGQDARISQLAFSPKGFLLAAILPDKPAAAFLELKQEQGGQYSLSLWGEPAPIGPYPSAGLWTPDGRFFVTTSRLYDSADSDQIVHTASAQMAVIRVAETVDLEGSAAVHERVAVISLPTSPDAVAMSPQGDLIAVATRRVAGTGDEWTGGRLTLLSFDRSNGAARVVSGHETSRSPSALAFDTKGSALLVTDAENNEVQVWKVERSPNRLVYTGLNIGSGPNPHAIAVVP